MKIQIERFSPHQTAKIVAVFLAVGSLVAMIPMLLFMWSVGSPDPAMRGHGPGIGMGVGMLILMPVMYLIFGYIMTAIAALIYNFLARYLGGIEFRTRATGE